jgi:uncharacterized membrane protein YsdA (DUF1294 family)
MTLMYYLIGVNVLGFGLMAIDKSKARKGQWRIRENHLFLVAFLGGALGSFLGMQAFHHKTKHWKFKVGVPILIVLNLAIILWLKRIKII